MKKSLLSLYTFLLTLIFTLCSVAGWGQTVWNYDFGTTCSTCTYTTNGNSTTFLSDAATTPANGGTYRVRRGNAGGGFTLANPGTTLGTGSELQIQAPTSAAATKFGVYDWTSPSSRFYLKAKVRTTSTGDGALSISLGTNAFPSDNNNSTAGVYNASMAFVTINYASGSISSVTRRNSGSNTTISPVSSTNFTKDTDQEIEIYANNANTATTYTRSGSNNLNANSWDLWIDGVKMSPSGGWGKAGTWATNTNIAGFTFSVESSASNAAYFYIDDLEYSNALPTAPSTTVTITAQDPNSIATHWNAGSINNIFYYAALTPAGGNATLSSVKANMTGSYLAADIANNGFKLYYSADFDFTPAEDALLGAVSSAKSGATETLTWSSLTQAITASSTGYIYAVADVASSATDGRTVAGTFTGNSNIVFSPTVTYSDYNTYGLTVNKTIVNTSPQLQYENGNNLNFGNVCINTTASTTGSFDLYGFNLTGDVTVGALSGYSYSTTLSGTYTSSLPLSPDGSGDLAETIYVKFTPTSAQSYNGNIAISGGGATTINVAVSGTGINGTPTIATNAATPVVNTTAQLNGNNSPAATCYSITQRGFIYSKTADNNNPTNTAVNGTTVFKVPVGTGTGSYNTNLTGLTPSTGYSYVAYVTDGTNYFYGAVQTFTTLGVATQIAFNPAPPATGNTNANLTTFKVEARRADNTVDTEYTGTVTLTKNSGPGNIQGTVSFNAVAGVATFSAVQFNAAGTYTIRAASGSFTNIVSGNIVISTLSAATDFFRSRSAGPNDWNAAGSWESSPSALGPWMTATRYPDEDASGVEIRVGHTININTSDIYITNTKVFGVLKVTTSSPFFIAGTAGGIELEIENGGVLDVSNKGYVSYASSSFGLVKTGGKIIANPGADADYFLYDYLDYDDGKFYFADNAIAEWNLESYPPTSNDYYYGIYNDNIIFPYPYNSGAMPIFRISNISSDSSFGYGSTANPSTINAKLELNTTKTFNIHNNANQKFIYILGGISGQGTINQFGTDTRPGQLILGDATTVPELGGNINLRMISNRLKLPNGANIPSGANVLIERNAPTDQNGIIDKSGGSININGVLDISNMRIENATAGNVSVNSGGKLRTRNTGGLFGTGSAIPGGTVNINIGSTIEYYATANQSISSGKDYYHIIFSGAGTKTPGNNINVHTDGSVTITGTPTVNFASSNLASTAANNTAFTMSGGRLRLGTAATLPNMKGFYNITGGTIEFTNNAHTINTSNNPNNDNPPRRYHNIEITVSSTGQVRYGAGNLTLNPDATVLVKTNATLTSTNGNASLVGTTNNTLKLEPNATFRTAVIPGFYGPAVSGLNPSPSVRNNITLDLDPGSIIEYARLSGEFGLPADASSGDQQIVALSNGYPNLKVSGDGIKMASGDITVNGMTSVTNTSATLLVPDYDEDNPVYSNFYALGGIANDGDAENFIVGSDANLFQNETANNGTAKIQVNRSVTDMDNTSAQLDYVYWSSPVAGQNIREFSPGTPWNRRFQYNESTDYFVPTTDTYFTAGKGYAIEAESNSNGAHLPNIVGYNDTYKFKGVPNNGGVSIGIQRTNSGTTGAGLGYNLVGNPYPSNIKFDELYLGNRIAGNDLIYATAWFWTNNSYTATQQGSNYGGNNYAVYNFSGGTPAAYNPSDPYTGSLIPNGIIKVGQAFIIQKKAQGTGNLIFKNSYGTGHDLRVTTPGTFFQRGASSAKNRFWVELVSPTEMVNTQLIGYISGATDAYEQDFDAESFGMSSDIFYSILNDKKLLIQGRSDNFSIDDVVPLGANIFSNGNYKIQLRDPEGIFETSQNIYLKDNLLNTYTNLQQESYTFAAAKGITENRFEIVYKPGSILTTDQSTKDQLVVYRNGDEFVVKSNLTTINEVEVFDASGRLIREVKSNALEVKIDGTTLNSGIYLLKIKRGDRITTKKVLR